MSIIGKRKFVLLLVGLMLFTLALPAQASFDFTQEYYLTIDILVGKNVSELLGSRQKRLETATIVYLGSANQMREIYATLEKPNPGTRVFLASNPNNAFFFYMYLFAPGLTWVFSCNTLFGQVVAGPMNYYVIPGASELVMTTLKEGNNISNYYEVGFSDILMELMNPGPTSSPRTYTPASLNQQMSTRSGPGTQYTEELGTFPQNTEIMLVESVTTGVPWGMVEFYWKGMKHRAYTGMKRINAYGPVAQGTQDYYEVVLSQTTSVYYGPGYDYAQRKDAVRAGTTLRVYGSENGFSMCDYKSGKQWVRAYFPVI